MRLALAKARVRACVISFCALPPTHPALLLLPPRRSSLLAVGGAQEPRLEGVVRVVGDQRGALGVVGPVQGVEREATDAEF